MCMCRPKSSSVHEVNLHILDVYIPYIFTRRPNRSTIWLFDMSRRCLWYLYSIQCIHKYTWNFQHELRWCDCTSKTKEYKIHRDRDERKRVFRLWTTSEGFGTKTQIPRLASNGIAVYVYVWIIAYSNAMGSICWQQHFVRHQVINIVFNEIIHKPANIYHFTFPSNKPFSKTKLYFESNMFIFQSQDGV